MSLAPGITSRRRWLAERSIPNTKANQTQNSASQTQSTEVFIKKKKKKSSIHKPKSNPVNHLPTDGHVVAVVAAASSSSSSSFAWSPLIADRRSENGERRSMFGVRRSVLPPALRQCISLFFLSDSFSVSRSLIFISVFLSPLGVLLLADRHRRRRRAVIGSLLCLCACSGERSSLPPPAVRPSVKVSLYLSLSFSLFISLNV